jgi:P27 family predicted phage terminase small subunit
MPRKPVELRAIDGTPGKRRLPNAPKAPPLLENPPAELGPRGRDLWERVRDAFAAPVVQESDYAALMSLCQAWELAQTALDDLRERGAIVESSRADRELVRNPSMMIWAAASERVNKLLAAFGMTPAARAAFDLPRVDTEPNPALEIMEANRRR